MVQFISMDTSAFFCSMDLESMKELIDKQPSSPRGFLLKCGILDFNEYSLFYKELDKNRIQEIYSSSYSNLFQQYYQQLNSTITTHRSIGLIEDEKHLIEIQPQIPSEKIFLKGAAFSWKDLYQCYKKILTDVDKVCNAYGKGDFSPIGIETALWNFTSDGLLYDFNPPRIFNENCLFTHDDSSEMFEKTQYRNFSREGMKTNLLATVFKGHENGDFTILGAPSHWKNILKLTLIKNLHQTNATNEVIMTLEQHKLGHNFPKWHPVSIIKGLQYE